MRLYHYTAAHHAVEIAYSGAISGGGVPICSPDGVYAVGLVPGWQWLTSDPDWSQAWATREAIGCDRTECRLVVAIPLLDRTRLYRWDDVAHRFGYTEPIARRFAEIGGGKRSDLWYVFAGAIPSGWIVDLEYRPDVDPSKLPARHDEAARA